MLEGMCGNYLISECVVIIEYVAIISRNVCKLRMNWGLLKEEKLTN